MSKLGPERVVNQGTRAPYGTETIEDILCVLLSSNWNGRDQASSNLASAKIVVNKLFIVKLGFYLLQIWRHIEKHPVRHCMPEYPLPASYARCVLPRNS
jgi:hypothetical protein